MFDLSFETLFVLGLLAFILFGPQKLPEYAAKLGRLTAKLRQATTEMTQQVHNPFQYPQEPGQQPFQPDPQAASLPSSPQLTNCPHCGQMVSPDYTFCPKCGKRIHEEQLELPFTPDTSA